MPVPYTFGNATTSIPLSQLDTNFATAITIGNTAVYLGNTTTSFGNVTLTNVTISSGNATVTKITAPTHDAGSGNALTLQSNSTTALYIDTSQNVGIGTTSPSSKLSIGGGLDFKSYIAHADNFALYANSTDGTTLASYTGYPITFRVANTERMRIDSSGNVIVASGQIRQQSGSAASPSYSFSTTQGTGMFSPSSGQLAFAGGTSEYMRIDSSGNLLVGTTDSSFFSGVGFKLVPSATAPTAAITGSSSSNTDVTYRLYSTGAAANRFYVGYGGQIYATSTTISALSDGTLKENIRDLETGLNEIMALRPRRFNWKKETKIEDKNIAGFIAQEVEKVLPDLVYDYQYNETEIKKSLKMGDILPTLVKAIQQLKAELDALKGTK